MYEESSIVLYIIVGGTIGMLLISSSIIFFVLLYQRKMLQNKLDMQNLETDFQKQLLAKELESQETERNRVGSELHDSVGAMLSTIRLSMKMAISDHNKLKELSGDLTKYLDETIESVRTISRDLYPAGLKSFGVLGVVNELAERITKSQQLEVQCESQGEVVRMSQKNELMIFRIMQELINNAIKHSRATHLHILFKWQEEKLVINVEDDGIGFTTEQLDPAKRGIGLYNISNRAVLINANVKFANLENSGAHIIITVPFSSGTQDETK